MNNTFLMAVNRPQRLVGRQKQLAEIRQAIFTEGNECRIILIKGAGGLGKTRLIEETLARLGNPEKRELYGPITEQDDWLKQETRPVIAANLLDLADIWLQARQYFLQTLGDSQTWQEQVHFGHYMLAHNRWRRLSESGVDHAGTRQAAAAAEAAFWQDYQAIAARQRIVLPLDTAESLATVSSQWLIEHDLLQPEDLRFNTQQWLLDQIEAGRFTNTTLIMAGRDSSSEGGPYFERIEALAAREDIACEIASVFVEPFTLAETADYFALLQEDQALSTADSSPSPATTKAYIQAVLQMLLDDEEKLQVLHLYTGGQPIRLALYTDVLVESSSIPEPLQQTLAEAQAHTKSRGEETPQLLEVRRQIEAEFIDILFGAENNLHARILRSLARSTRGLSPEQVHFILDRDPAVSIADWQPDKQRLAEIEAVMQKLRSLSIVKPKPGNRLGLQDEMYRIFAECMAANEQTRQKEKAARQWEYKQLFERADKHRQALYDQDERLMRDDLERIRPERPANILSTRMAVLTAAAAEERSRLEQALLNDELEYLHYALLIDPVFHFNYTYYNLANDRVNAYKEDQVALFQAEMWRALNDEYAFKFIDLPPRPVATRRGEDALTVLRRAAQTNDAVNWIVRFYLYGQYQKAIDLAQQIEAKIATLPNPHERHSWGHTLARRERDLWVSFCRIFLGASLTEHNQAAKEIVADLEALSRVDTDTMVFPERGAEGERGMKGHPAQDRLHFIITLTYNRLGYGLAMEGDFEAAVDAYTRSLQYARTLPHPLLASQEATVRNNLARALAELGKKRANRVCRDGLALRIKLGDWLPIAVSYNTLALIQNTLYMPVQALDAAARAWAIAQRVANPRTQGLVLLQLGESLRRLVGASRTEAVTLSDAPEEVYREAERALQQAVEIFAAGEEKLRLVEAYIQIGCLYRDWTQLIEKGTVTTIWQQHKQNALFYLNQAVKLAHQLDNIRYQLVALVDIAWMRYYAAEYEAVDDIYKQVKILAPTQAQFQVGYPPPQREEVHNYIFWHLAKIYGLHGRVAFEQFTILVNKIETSQPDLTLVERHELVRQDTTAQALLQQAADAYVQALGYAELYSSRSAALTVIYDQLYDFLKRLNSSEFQAFYQYEAEATEKYRIGEIKSDSFGDLRHFLLDCFGDYYDADVVAALG
jgi:hypothetical protein